MAEAVKRSPIQRVRARLKPSPLTKRRFQNFKRNKRGYWSFWLLTVLFFISLFAELLANDKPLIVSYDNKLYFPVFQDPIPETTFGGFFQTEAEYREQEVKDMINEKGWMLWPPIRFSYKTVNFARTDSAPSKPSAENLLGTDDQARDVLARVIYGFRISLWFGIVLTALSSVVGVAAGAVQGYFGGWVDLFFQRFIEIWSGMPRLFMLIILASIFNPSFLLLLGLLLLFEWMSLVGVVRAEFLRTRNFEYVRAARGLGVRDSVIMYKHVLPNAMTATLTFLPFVMIGSITALTSLDFLGFGLPVGSPSLGELLNQGKNNLHAPWLGLTSFFVLAIMLSLLIFIGEAVRDAFDPRKMFQNA